LQPKEEIDDEIQSLISKHNQDIEEMNNRLDAIKVSIACYACYRTQYVRKRG